MKNLITVLGLFASSFSCASSSVVNIGPNFTSGASTSPQSIFAASYNPATAAFALSENEKWRFNFSPALAFSTEVGEVDNFVDELDELIDIIDDASNTNDSVEEVLERFNTVLVQMGETGYIKANVALRAPLIPFYFRSEALDGTFYVDYQMNAQVGGRVLDDELEFDNQNLSFTTSSSLYLKSGIENLLSLSFAKTLKNSYFASAVFPDLHLGARLNVITLELSKQVLPLQVLDGASVEDVIEDEYDNNLASSTGLSADLGAILADDAWRVGLTLANIGSPSFDYGVVGENCESREDDTAARTSCEVAKYFAETLGEIRTRETHTKHPLLTIDGAYSLAEQWWLSASLDLAKYDDFVGFENQWFHSSLAFNSNKLLVPSARLGIQANLADEGTSSLTFGFTAFHWFNFDFEYGLDTVVVDGDSLPRRLGFSFSVFERF